MKCFIFCGFLLLFIFVFPNTSNAQVLRIKGGANVSTIGGDAQGNKYKMGFHCGIAGILEISNELQIQPELLLSGQGTRPTEYIASNYWYLNSPILLTYKTPQYTLHAGPQVGLLLGARIRNRETGSDEVVTTQVNNLDFSLAMGVEIPLTNKFAVQGRYNYGISNTAGHNAVGDLKFFNRVIQLSLILNLCDK